jgi:hypothetical protein
MKIELNFYRSMVDKQMASGTNKASDKQSEALREFGQPDSHENEKQSLESQGSVQEAPSSMI